MHRDHSRSHHPYSRWSAGGYDAPSQQRAAGGASAPPVNTKPGIPVYVVLDTADTDKFTMREDPVITLSADHRVTPHLPATIPPNTHVAKVVDGILRFIGLQFLAYLSRHDPNDPEFGAWENPERHFTTSGDAVLAIIGTMQSRRCKALVVAQASDVGVSVRLFIAEHLTHLSSARSCFTFYQNYTAFRTRMEAFVQAFLKKRFESKPMQYLHARVDQAVKARTVQYGLSG